MCRKRTCWAPIQNDFDWLTSWRGPFIFVTVNSPGGCFPTSQDLAAHHAAVLVPPNTVQLRGQIITGFYSREMLPVHRNTSNSSSLGQMGGWGGGKQLYWKTTLICIVSQAGWTLPRADEWQKNKLGENDAVFHCVVLRSVNLLATLI